MGGIYEVRRPDGLRCTYVHTEFHNDLFSHSKFNKGGICKHKDSVVIAWAYVYFYQNKENRLKIKVSLCGHHAEPIFMKLGTHIMATEPISTAYFINPSNLSVCLYVYPLIVARQRLGRNVTAAMNTQATTEELLDASFTVRSVLYQRKAGY
jgi:hypothetical protein